MTSLMSDEEFKEAIKDQLNRIEANMKDAFKTMTKHGERITRLEATGVALRWAATILLAGIAALGGVIVKILNSSK